MAEVGESVLAEPSQGHGVAVALTIAEDVFVLATPRDRLDKAVQVHIRTLDKRLVACSVLSGVLAVALVAVVLFAILER